MAFKLPEVPPFSKKNHIIQKIYDELPVTLSKDVQVVREIGSGSFGRVMLCTKKGKKQVILKEMRTRSDRQAQLFVKEAKILYTFKQRNIVQFDSLYQSDDPDTLAFLMEYVYFDFKHFKQRLKVSSLAELLHRLDKSECKNFEHFQMIIARDITRGLAYLHENDVVHRDLKPDNVLISNQHYSNPVEMEKVWKMKPVVAKITDFGESRASEIQTLTLIDDETSWICRGTAAFLAPEAYTDDTVKFGMIELKSIDIWALLMIFYVLINPNKDHPFEDEIISVHRAGISMIMIMKHIFKNHSAPKHSDKYKRLRLTQWKTISDIIETGTSTERPSIGEVLRNLEKEFDADRKLEKMGEIARLNNVYTRICKVGNTRNDAIMLMSPESNWDLILTAAPFAIALLGEIISMLADTDFSLEEKPLKYGYNHLCRPNSFRASLVQVINAERSSFNEAHSLMDQLILHNGNVDGHVENTIRILLRGTPNEVVKMLPMSLTKIQNIPDVSLNLTNAVVNRFFSVMELTGELIEACTNNLSVKMAQLKLKHIDVNKIRATLNKCIEALSDFREQCGKLVRYFQTISDIIKCCLRTVLQDFVCAAKSGQELKMGDLSTNDSNNIIKDFILQPASEVSKIAYIVCAISKTYSQISNKHLMHMITCLDNKIALDPQKEGKKILIEKRVLHSGCYKAQKAIKSIVLQHKLEFNQNIEERVRKKEEIQAKLTHFEPKREEKIKKSDGMKNFTDAELADLI